MKFFFNGLHEIDSHFRNRRLPVRYEGDETRDFLDGVMLQKAVREIERELPFVEDDD